MKTYLTTDWLRKFAGTYRSSSFQDKIAYIAAEPNPMMLVEWLLFPPEETLRSDVGFQRSPGMFKNSYVPFDEVFFHQLLFETLFNMQPKRGTKDDLLLTAVYDLQSFLKKPDRFEQAINDLQQRVEQSLAAFGRFTELLDREKEKLNVEYRSQLYALNADTDLPEDEKDFRKQNAAEQWRRKTDELPRKLLQKHFDKEHPMVAYLHYKGWADPRSHVMPAMETMNSIHPTKHNPNSNSIEQQTPPGLLRYINEHSSSYHEVIDKFLTQEVEAERFISWFIAVASKGGMNRGEDEVSEGRRRWWAGLLTLLSLSDTDAARSVPMNIQTACLEAVFHTSGFEDTLMATHEIPVFFADLVLAGLPVPEHREWLRNKVILRHWQRFVKEFTDKEYQFLHLAWVLCLDPVNLQQRLLRSDQSQSTEFIIDRCCLIFGDAVRRGLSDELTVPLFQYFAVHDKDLLYSLIYRMKHLEEVKPLLSVEARYLGTLFHGENIRAAGSRKHLASLLLQSLFSKSNLSMEDSITSVQRWTAERVKEDQAMLALTFLEKYAETHWPVEAAASLASMANIRWLGESKNASEGHHWVLEQLKDRSERIAFEAAPQGNTDELNYRIIRPGAEDQASGEILARAVIRAEWTDASAISNMLDDLMNL
ncbi:hypothetical protein SY83_17835 [Paenibacillus swuensis]|uniref:Uncharacterized protein n=1 Tax=Paenibacillus swuensis TaxID=1178515 RepID=A0A172TLB0_9BACL|nr:hypothetical protein [Paenibacillus swuensis]ANE47845.1 hypothetical protein SY83_17835 [Paenibacillus swuensis]